MVSHINFNILSDIKSKYNLFNINDNDNNNNISLNIHNDINEEQNIESIRQNIENKDKKIENEEKKISNEETKIVNNENSDINNNNLKFTFEKLQLEVIQSLKKYTKNKKNWHNYNNNYNNNNNYNKYNNKYNNSYTKNKNYNNYNNSNIDKNIGNNESINSKNNFRESDTSKNKNNTFPLNVFNNSKLNWRKNCSKLNCQLNNIDKNELNINKELNKLSINNFENIYNSVINIFCNLIYHKIVEILKNECLDLNKFDDNKNKYFKSLQEHINKYQNILWYNIINKIIIQPNYCENYFKFILKLVTIKHNNYINNIIINIFKKKIISFINVIDDNNKDEFDYSSLSIMELPKYKTKINNESNTLYYNIICKFLVYLNTQKLNFTQINQNKNNLIKNIIDFLNNDNYLTIKENKSKLENLLNNDKFLNNENTFFVFGKFTNFFIDITKKRNNLKNISEIFITGLFDNFKIINDMLVWEPINLEEIQYRINFIIGFLNDNKSFVNNITKNNFDFIESELNTIKSNENLPSNLKFKLLDCIDNIKKCKN